MSDGSRTNATIVVRTVSTYPEEVPDGIDSRTGNPFQKPGWIVLRRVDVAKKKRRISFTYKEARKPIRVADHADFLQKMKVICEPCFRFPRLGHPDFIDPTPRKPRDSTLSLNCKELAYLVFLLDDDVDWNFSADFAPISAGVDSVKYYSYSAKFDQHGSPHVGRASKPGSKVAVVIFDGATAYSDAKDAGKSGFVHAFNLHIDLYGMDGSDVIVTPIIVDPDVREPGGSGA